MRNPFSQSWHVAEQFNTASFATFSALLAAGRLAHIGFCLPSGRTGEFASTDEALAWMADGKNVYADILQISEAGEGTL